ncbi:scavenger receptor cysteine-rich type 1 protein M130-like [Perca flavescens]|uniref:scavenger receptor cysteine-rich type 1 protein M130-like n=1 Tax=Perca flavescens TaxID=8167 RepID=UPI00106E64CF|nr:scavenger receptor cysteine-rich type 1 protein M130-like [Perca flavescens]
MKAAEIVCPEKCQAFANISLTRNTVADRISDLSVDLDSQLKQKVKSFIAFSVAIDESTDITDVAQLAIFIREVDDTLTVTEEFVKLVPMTDTMTAADIFTALVGALDRVGVDWSRAVSLATDDSVRLMNGTSLCSGRLEVKTNQRWSSVCDDFDQQDAEVVCRELGCGPPSVLQGALYGEVDPPMRTKEFQCGGHESTLLDCRSSGSDRNTCSPGKAVGLTCSEPVRLVGGASRCAGTLEVKLGEWRPVRYSSSGWTLKTSDAACRELDCGSAVSVGERKESSRRYMWFINSLLVEPGSALREYARSSYSSSILNLTCSGSIK